MISNHYGLLSLLSPIDDLEGNLWNEYSRSLEDSGDWELDDAASLLIAWLVATNRCTMDDLNAGLKVFQKIRAVMDEAMKEMGEKQS